LSPEKIQNEVDLFDGNFAYSDIVDIEITDGEMWTSVYEK